MSTDLHELVTAVHDEESFLSFLQALLGDWESVQQLERLQSRRPSSPNTNDWENLTIGTFLEASIAWARDSQDSEFGPTPDQNPWFRCAQIFLMGKLYE